MITKEQRLALNSKGYDLVFEYGGKPYALKSDSINNWSEEKRKKFEQETGLRSCFLDNNWVFYNPKQYRITDTGYLLYIGDDGYPDQPINYFNYDNLFYNYGGKSLDLSHWDTRKITSFSEMFNSCYELKTLNLAGWDVRNVYSCAYMFYWCKSLKTLDLSGWRLENCETCTHMFNCCGSLESLNLSNWCVDECDSFFSMFENCYSLTSLDISSWNVSKGDDFACMFKNCSSLTSLDLSQWDVSNCTMFNEMFKGCKALRLLNLDGWSIPKRAECYGMFDDVTLDECSGADLMSLWKQGQWEDLHQIDLF